MLSRSNRFHGLGSLRAVYQKGLTKRLDQVTLRYYLNPKRKNYRVAVVISKKTEKSAVKRNRLRRRIYEILRQNLAQLDQPYDIVLSVFNNNIFNSSPAQLEKLIKNLIDQANIIKS